MNSNKIYPDKTYRTRYTGENRPTDPGKIYRTKYTGQNIFYILYNLQIFVSFKLQYTGYIFDGIFCPVYIVRYILSRYVLSGILYLVYIVRYILSGYVMFSIFYPVCFIRIYFVQYILSRYILSRYFFPGIFCPGIFRLVLVHDVNHPVKNEN